MIELTTEQRRDARTFSHSQLRTWHRCQQKWVYNYVWDIIPKGKGNKWLHRGTLVHELLSVVDQMMIQGVKAGDPILWDYVVEFCQTDLLARMPLDQLDNYNAALKVARRYVDEWSPIMDSNIRLLSVEDEFLVPMETFKGRVVMMNGYIDRTHLDEYGHLVVLDRKSSATGKHWTEKMLETDSQTAYYCLALTEAGMKPWSVEIDSISTYPYKRFETEPIDKIFRRLRQYRPPKELAFFADNFRRAADDVIDYLEKNQPPVKTIDRDCSMCPYVDLCVYEMKGIPIAPLLAEKFENKRGIPINVPQAEFQNFT